MPAFHYAAVDASGRTHKGVLQGDTARQIRQVLRERELLPVEVNEVVGGSTNQRYGGRISATRLALLTRQLATLVQAGLPLEEALAAVARQSEKVRLERLLLAVRARVLEGHSLAAALNEFPKTFPELYRATVAAGEQSGHLDVVLERLADYTESRRHVRQTTLLALLYPAILTLVALLIVIGLLTYVVPQVVQVFESTNQTLPGLTRGLIAFSDFIHTFGWLLLAIGGALVVACVLGWRYLAWRRRIQRALLHLPLIGRMLRGVHSARFARTFSVLLGSSVPVLEALRISARVIGALPMREAVIEAATKVKEGASLQQALAVGGYFPPLTLQLIASGEASGRLEYMLQQAASQQERETETLIAAVLGLFEPLLILLMGGIVLVIVLAVLLPIFDLNQMIK